VSGARPATVVLVTGTGTEVGKTWVSARLIEAWRAAGLTVAARKPAQSFAPGDGPTDAEVLAGASGEDAETVCPPTRSYPVPMAPPMAADALGRPLPTLAELADVVWPRTPVTVGLVETAGGVRSPQGDDGDVTDLLGALSPDAVVLVADAGLGTVNVVRLSLDALIPVLDATARDRRHRPCPVVVLNRFDPASDLHRRNRDWLRERCGCHVVEGTPSSLSELATQLATQPATQPATPR